MKKFLLINLLIIFIIFIIAELSSYVMLFCKYKEDIIIFNNIVNSESKINIPFLKYSKVTLPNKKNLLSGFRPVEYKNPDLKPIILFGCSYTEGFGLKENETFSHKLAQYTNRSVYNRGVSGTGIPFLYYQLNDDDVIKELPKNPQYIIFTLIPDHFPRLFRYRNFVLTSNHSLRYKIQDNKLIEDKIKFPFLHSFFTSIVIEEYITNKNSSDPKKVKDLTVKLFDESYKKIKENFPGAKFVILYFECPLDEKNRYNELLKDISKISDDIIILYINDKLPQLTEHEEYWLQDKSHPSSKAWDLIVPMISKELNF